METKRVNAVRLNTIIKINQNKCLFSIVLFGILGVMLILNHYTLYAVDDYAYMFSFATHKKIVSVWDIFPSMYMHAQTMNGRLVAHFFVQLFLLLPSFLFDITNAIIFVMLILILYKYLFWDNRINVLALVSIFA